MAEIVGRPTVQLDSVDNKAEGTGNPLKVTTAGKEYIALKDSGPSPDGPDGIESVRITNNHGNPQEFCASRFTRPASVAGEEAGSIEFNDDNWRITSDALGLIDTAESHYKKALIGRATNVANRAGTNRVAAEHVITALQDIENEPAALRTRAEQAEQKCSYLDAQVSAFKDAIYASDSIAVETQSIGKTKDRKLLIRAAELIDLCNGTAACELLQQRAALQAANTELQEKLAKAEAVEKAAIKCFTDEQAESTKLAERIAELEAQLAEANKSREELLNKIFDIYRRLRADRDEARAQLAAANADIESNLQQIVRMGEIVERKQSALTEANVQLAAERKKVEELREALRPFAETPVSHIYGDQEPYAYGMCFSGGGSIATVLDFRKAKAALAQPTPAPSAKSEPCQVIGGNLTDEQLASIAISSPAEWRADEKWEIRKPCQRCAELEGAFDAIFSGNPQVGMSTHNLVWLEYPARSPIYKAWSKLCRLQKIWRALQPVPAEPIAKSEPITAEVKQAAGELDVEANDRSR